MLTFSFKQEKMDPRKREENGPEVLLQRSFFLEITLGSAVPSKVRELSYVGTSSSSLCIANRTESMRDGRKPEEKEFPDDTKQKAAAFNNLFFSSKNIYCTIPLIHISSPLLRTFSEVYSDPLQGQVQTKGQESLGAAVYKGQPLGHREGVRRVDLEE